MTIIWPSNIPPRVLTDRLSGEKQALDEWVDFHRATLLMKCEGLTPEQLKTRSVEPSALTLLGLVRHMSDVERGWFRLHAGRQVLEFEYSTEADPDAYFLNLETADASADLAHFVTECQLSRQATASLSL